MKIVPGEIFNLPVGSSAEGKTVSQTHHNHKSVGTAIVTTASSSIVQASSQNL